MKTKVLAVALIGIFVAMSMSALPSAGAAKSSTQVKWMELLYLDADNNLDVNAGAHHTPVVQADFDELTSVGSTKDVVSYVLVDRLNGPGNLYKVNKGSLEEIKSFPLNGLELNMGDPAVLRSFVSFTTKMTKPLHTLLIFWDHGTPEYCAYDDHAGPNAGADILTHQEAIQALKGYHIDVIGADECLLGQIEVVNEYVAKGLNADYAVVSETYTGWRGFPYDWTLRDLVASPGMTARQVATMMVDDTQLLLSQNPYMGEEVTSHGAIDLSKVNALSNSIMDLVGLMTPDMKTYASLVSKARGGACFSYGANALNLVDLKTFVEKIAANTDDKQIQDACALVIANFDATVIDLQTTQTMDKQINGLGICLPNHSWEMPSFYTDFAFPNMGWLAFLQAYWAAAGSV
jgi:hypothetical protein